MRLYLSVMGMAALLLFAPLRQMKADRTTDDAVSSKAANGDYIGLGRLLSKHRVSRAAKNDALIGAAWKGQDECVSLLLKYGADPNYMNDGETALFQAARRGNLELAALLIKRGANVKSDVASLMVASAWCHADILKLLLEHSARVNVTDHHTRLTPLILACSAEMAEEPELAAVRVLISYHARVDQRDQNGHTALWHARKAGHSNVVALLKSMHAKG